MNATQKWVTGMMAVLMLGTILAMPSQLSGHASAAKRVGVVSAPAQASVELPQGEVRDLSY
jgi:hypothetical protein